MLWVDNGSHLSQVLSRASAVRYDDTVLTPIAPAPTEFKDAPYVKIINCLDLAPDDVSASLVRLEQPICELKALIESIVQRGDVKRIALLHILGSAQPFDALGQAKSGLIRGLNLWLAEAYGNKLQSNILWIQNDDARLSQESYISRVMSTLSLLTSNAASYMNGDETTVV